MLRIIPLGGLGEVGKNMTVFEYGRDIMLVDAGVMFPEYDMYGIDLVIPDFTYVREHADNVRGIVITHGHEDHIGALPYLLREVNVPIYASQLARGFIENKLREHKDLRDVSIRTIKPRDRVTVGPFDVEFILTTHSIPDGMALAIRTPVGTVLHTSDFKIEHTAVQGEGPDLGRLAQIGAEGVLALLSDSTGAERPGITPPESVVEEALDDIFRQAPGRIIITTFASSLTRIQNIINLAQRHQRKVALAGYSMRQNVRVARDLGYLHVPDEALVDLRRIGRGKMDKLVILTTGSQGQPEAALGRMAEGRHADVTIRPGDTVIFSASPIPGNEEEVSRIINALLARGADVIYPPLMPVHVSGHGSQEEQKLLLNLARPRYFVPVHGELRHLHAHARLARSVGMPEDRIFVLQNGDVLALSKDRAEVQGSVPAEVVFVDGTGVGDIGPAVLREREVLGRDGVVMVLVSWDPKKGLVGKPQVTTRGFVYVRESEDLLLEIQERLQKMLQGFSPATSPRKVEEKARDMLGKFLYQRTRRRPMIVPVVMVC